MIRQRRPTLIVAVAALLLLAAYAVRWATLGHGQIVRTDFSQTYVGGTLFRQGAGAHLYDLGRQSGVFEALTGLKGDLPFNNPPTAAVLAAPVTMLGFDTAFHAWQLVQGLLLIGAAMVAVRAAPWPSSTPRHHRYLAAATGLAGLGTYGMLVQAQIDGFIALGLACGYWAWKRDRPAWAGVLLIAPMLAIKPHLALGVAAFVIGTRNRRAIYGAAAGTLLVVAASLEVVGPTGLVAYAHEISGQATRWPLATMAGFNGIPGSWFGEARAAYIVGLVGTVVCTAAAAMVGERVRRGHCHIEVGLATATVLSLLGSPHTYLHDLPVLLPVFVWVTARLAQSPRALWSRGSGGAVLGLWAGLTVAAAVDFGNGAVAFPGRLIPWVLIGAALLAWRVPPPPGPDRSLMLVGPAPAYSGSGSGVGGAVV